MCISYQTTKSIVDASVPGNLSWPDEIWQDYDAPIITSDGNTRITSLFTQLTINADDHPLMRRFHKPGAEKRSLVIVGPDEWDDWLGCRNPGWPTLSCGADGGPSIAKMNLTQHAPWIDDGVTGSKLIR